MKLLWYFMSTDKLASLYCYHLICYNNASRSYKKACDLSVSYKRPHMWKLVEDIYKHDKAALEIRTILHGRDHDVASNYKWVETNFSGALD